MLLLLVLSLGSTTRLVRQSRRVVHSTSSSGVEEAGIGEHLSRPSDAPKREWLFLALLCENIFDVVRTILAETDLLRSDSEKTRTKQDVEVIRAHRAASFFNQETTSSQSY